LGAPSGREVEHAAQLEPGDLCQLPAVVAGDRAVAGEPHAGDARVTVASGARRGQLLAARRLVPARGAKPPKRLQVRLTRTGAALVQRRAVATARVTVALLDGADRARASFLLALAKPTER